MVTHTIYNKKSIKSIGFSKIDKKNVQNPKVKILLERENLCFSLNIFLKYILFLEFN